MTSDKKDNGLMDKPLRVVQPDWDSHSGLINTIMELEQLRTRRLGGTTPPHVFFRLKEVFHTLESLGSSRIEGNRTTLAELAEKMTAADFEEAVSHDERLREIDNIKKAIRYVEDAVEEGTKMTRVLLSNMHKIITDMLTPPSRRKGGEGSLSPGDFRKESVEINNSKLVPPDYTQVPDYVEELLDFVNDATDPKDHLLRAAIAHHRFAYIHPFDNGNGRSVRVFTYALLIKYGFQVKTGHILNPTAIFCMDRTKYYDMLEIADSGKDDDMLAWCSYVLEGLLAEIKKIDKLLDYSYLRKNILLPAVGWALEYRLITDDEHTILSHIIRAEYLLLRAADVKKILGIQSSVTASRRIKGLREKRLLKPIKEGGRVYTISFESNCLFRGVADALQKHGFAPGLE